uniref:LNR domain-containing protein n=1 Tax=Chromera velia CCMP2878 TaxID=1169474 RepID=A0A0G4H8E8_9ALVE|eukprot:Cvel_25125.t1-p1 / transcript=Cvel_25125.t1 / gene=Cvel_25125 / organism=Chromera_velia_CCMP2878 / gene_product=hypothetical protein / transcript_product=hypothetical protein / location=Cvel_scaffold2806:9902-15876(-) / protein_length=769 / sequence_SO=supercontig / SO=protein_coding / is_pseudo=false
MRALCCIAVCLFGAAASDPSKLLEGLKAFSLGDGLGGKTLGEEGGKKEKNFCGDGVVDLATEECDEGKANGLPWPESFCTSECMYVPEVVCPALLINSTEALEEAQRCRTAEDVEFQLNTAIDVVMPNLTIVLPGGVIGSREDPTNLPNLAKSISMPNLIFAQDEIDFDEESPELETLEFASLMYTDDIELQDMPNLRTFSAPKLVSTDGDVQILRDPQLVTIDMDGARIIEDQFELEDLDKLQVLKLSHLEHVGRVDIERCPLLHTVEMPSLYSVGVAINLVSLPTLKSFRAPLLTLSGRLVFPDDTRWDFSELGTNPLTVFEFCRLPAVEIRFLEEREELCSDGTKCTVEGPLSPACKEALKEGKAEKEEKKTDDLFDLSGLDVGKMPLGGKFDLGLKEGLGGLRFGLGGETGKKGGDKGEKPDGGKCSFPVPVLEKKAAVCGNGILETGEECDGDGTVCDNETCKFRTEVVCEFDSFSLNSTADLQELENCAVIIGDVQLGIAAPTDLELPVLQVIYGAIESFVVTPLKRLILPGVWKSPGPLLSGPGLNSFPDLEAVELPCVLQSFGWEIFGSPNFNIFELPKLQVARTLVIEDSCDAAKPFDLVFPDLRIREEVRLENCPGVRKLVDPSLVFQENPLRVVNCANIELLFQPKMSLLFDSIVDLQDNPKLRLLDRSSQVFAQSTPPVRITASNNSPGGLEMRYCSLYVEQVDELRENGCQANADPPCFVLSGGSRECAAKEEKQPAGSEGFGLFGDTFKFELPKF